jgi:RNA polymerase sigma factor (TIGR02999 family)
MRKSRRRRVSPSRSSVGYPTTLSDLLPHVYNDLQCIAVYLCRRYRPDPLLEPLDLVQETYLRLAEQGPDSYISRAQFFYIAVRNMKWLLADHIRSRLTQKRGGGGQHVPIDNLELAAPEIPDMAAIETVMIWLKTEAPQIRHIIELRIFEDLSSKQIAGISGLGESTVRLKWRQARTQLRKELHAAGFRAGTLSENQERMGDENTPS